MSKYHEPPSIRRKPDHANKALIDAADRRSSPPYSGLGFRV